MLAYKKQRVPLKYILVTSVTIGFVFTLLYFWLSHQEKQLVMEQVKNQGRYSAQTNIRDVLGDVHKFITFRTEIVYRLKIRLTPVR